MRKHYGFSRDRRSLTRGRIPFILHPRLSFLSAGTRIELPDIKLNRDG